MDLTYIYRAFRPTIAKYTFFLSEHASFSQLNHIVGHKTSFSKFKKIEITSSIFPNYKSIKLKV